MCTNINIYFDIDDHFLSTQTKITLNSNRCACAYFSLSLRLILSLTLSSSLITCACAYFCFNCTKIDTFGTSVPIMRNFDSSLITPIFHVTRTTIENRLIAISNYCFNIAGNIFITVMIDV